MLKKLTAMSLSLMICLSLLPGKAAAMEDPENGTPVQVEDAENQTSPEDANAGIAPCKAVANTVLDDKAGGGVSLGESNGAGGNFGPQGSVGGSICRP